jgi:tetratricopeptide (TPR) repeat protein
MTFRDGSIDQRKRAFIIVPVSHHRVRVLLILVFLLLAIFLPLVVSGYVEWERAVAADSYAEAAVHYRQAALRLPWRADLYELAGHAHYHAQEYEQADAAYRKAFQTRTLSPEGWVAWGDVNYLAGDGERAAQIWEQGLAQRNISEELYPRLAGIYEAEGDFSTAAEYLERYVSTHVDDAARRFRLGLLLTLSDPDRARTELLGAAQLDSQLDPAVQTLRTALDLAGQESSASEAAVVIGRGLGLVKEWSLARAAFEEAIRQDEANAEAWAWLGEAHQQVDLTERARSELDQALALDPDSPTVRGLRGLYFQRTGNYREALTEFQAAARLEPDNPAWAVSIGQSHARLGDLIRALEAYQRATDLASEDPQYWRILAIFCAEYKVNIPDVGLPAAQRAVVLAGRDADSLDVLGWLLTLDERYIEAERMLTTALEADPQHASAHLHLGMLYMETGERTRAYDHLLRSRDLGNAEAEMILNQYFQ